MDLAVLYLGPPNLSSRRATPPDLIAVESLAENAVETARRIAATRLLVIEPQAYPSGQTFAAARSLDPGGGILGGCAVEGDGTRRFGAVFACVQFGPYAVEPFPLIDPRMANAGLQPQRDGIDAVAPGVFLIDRECFCAAAFDAALSSPWLIYDLCMRVRELGLPVRWDPSLSFGIELAIAGPAAAVDRRDFIRTWGTRLSARFDADTPARGAIRRTRRLPFGQRDVVTIPIPPTDVVLWGEGALTAKQTRSLVRAQRVSVTDARGDEARGVQALRDALRTRADGYLAVLHAAATPPEGWLERALSEVESRPYLRGVREEGRTLLVPSRIPLERNPSPHVTSMPEALDALLSPRAPAGEKLSVVLVAHCRIETHMTSFEAIYGGELDTDYRAVVTASRPASVASLKNHATLDLVVDETRTMAAGVNTALARARGDIVIVIADDFYPPPGWLDAVREAFALRPDMGILGFSSVLIEGPQCVELVYKDVGAFKMLAAQRRARMARNARLTEQLSALALAIDARALAAVGGFDKRLGPGRWGVEDLTVRIRRAGYSAYIAEDLVVHHFDPSLAEPFLDNPAEQARGAQIFAQKWRGRTDFDPALDVVALA